MMTIIIVKINSYYEYMTFEKLLIVSLSAELIFNKSVILTVAFQAFFLSTDT